MQKISSADTKLVLQKYIQIYNQNDTTEDWFAKIKTLCTQTGFSDNVKDYKKNPQNYKGSVADVSGIIRVALTTKKNTPDLYELAKLLGQKEVLNRLNSAIEKL